MAKPDRWEWEVRDIGSQPFLMLTVETSDTRWGLQTLLPPAMEPRAWMLCMAYLVTQATMRMNRALTS
jgi:hypothetical protein